MKIKQTNTFILRSLIWCRFVVRVVNLYLLLYSFDELGVRRPKWEFVKFLLNWNLNFTDVFFASFIFIWLLNKLWDKCSDSSTFSCNCNLQVATKKSKIFYWVSPSASCKKLTCCWVQILSFDGVDTTEWCVCKHLTSLSLSSLQFW